MGMNEVQLDNLYVYGFKLYPQDNHKWGMTTVVCNGIIIADDMKVAMNKVYEHCGVEFGKTITYPTIRHLATEELPYMKENEGIIPVGFLSYPDAVYLKQIAEIEKLKSSNKIEQSNINSINTTIHKHYVYTVRNMIILLIWFTILGLAIIGSIVGK